MVPDQTIFGDYSVYSKFPGIRSIEHALNKYFYWGGGGVGGGGGGGWGVGGGGGGGWGRHRQSRRLKRKRTPVCECSNL